jgi:hypothetical protein
MSLDRLFAESVVNRNNHVILGKRLKPLCLWHAVLLELIDSPLWHGNNGVTMTDLRLAVSICSDSFPKYQIPSGWRLCWWAWRTRKSSLATEAAKFSAYIRDFNAPPMLWTKDEEAKTDKHCPLPQPLDIAAWLIRHNISEDRAWNMPIGLAHWYYVAMAKHRGAEIDLVSPSEQMAIDKIKTKRAGGLVAEAG